MDILSILSFDAIFGAMVGFASHPLLKVITRIGAHLSVIIIIFSFLNEYRRFTLALLVGVLVLFVFASLTGCAGVKRKDVTIVENIAEIAVFGPSYCELELDDLRITLRQTMNEMTIVEQYFGFDVTQESTPELWAKRETYRNCTGDYRSTHIFINPFNGAR